MLAGTMQRLRALAALSIVGPLVVSSLLAIAPPAWAQDTDSVRLTLLSQTPWNSSYDETNGRTLELAFRAENLTDQPIEDLSIGVTLYGRLISRTAFEASLAQDTGFPIAAETLPREGSLPANGEREFTLTFQLDSAGISTAESGVYPLKVDLRSGFTSLAALRTPVIFLVRRPELPLSLSWTWVLDQPIIVDPQGTFTSTALQESLASGGVLASQLRALGSITGTDATDGVDLAVSPTLISQLHSMADGYRVVEDGTTTQVPAGEGGAAAAVQALDDLRAIGRSPTVRVSALPFSVPELPSLVDGGLTHDVPVQLQRGAETVRTALRVAPTSGVLRPPGAALDDATLRELEASGVSTLIVGPATVPPLSVEPLGFAGPPTASLDDGALNAIVPDLAVTALLQSDVVRDDPALGAQAMLGELASIWQEQPGLERGVALVLSEDLTAPAGFYPPFAAGISSAPWLDPMHASEFVTAYPPGDPSPLTAPAPRRFPTTYVAQLRQARRRVDTLRSMLVQPSDTPDRYDTMLLLAESRQFLSNPTDGLAFITRVRDAVGAIFDGITVDAPEVITLTSSNGSSIPVTVTNGSDEALRVGVQLVSPHLHGVPSTQLELGPGESRLVTFAVDVRSTGRFLVDLQVVAPGGRPIEERSFLVRSTVYNRIALIITIAAAAVLLALWARRLLPRRTS
jgi:uncharacterized protein DUF6049